MPKLGDSLSRYFFIVNSLIIMVQLWFELVQFLADSINAYCYLIVI
ncbi:hypothetical protein SOHN41_01217 [Shewanella sp. HN-41]|nr:hypothetical protein SOHN41_01217 [Shewanella sp. HN-41]